MKDKGIAVFRYHRISIKNVRWEAIANEVIIIIDIRYSILFSII